MADYSKDEIRRIEEKWRREWQRRGVYKVAIDPSRAKYYVLDMFPYPSGSGLHVGHPLGYIASDIVSRYKRLKGFNVLHPMGFDAFGLPAEQYAIQTGQHPAITTARNIETYKRQLRQIGFSFDWDREVQTSDPSFYKWTQWIFMQLFNAWYNKSSGDGKAEPITTLIAAFERNGNADISAACDEDTPRIAAAEWKSLDEKGKENLLQRYRIAYQSETVVNWCAALGTVLSNDEVKDGVSERGGYPVERIKMLQWSMRISAYAERLLKGLDTIDWPENIKEIQRNWIGKSVGCELDFRLEPANGAIRVFTTRIDTIFGVTFMVLAPEHELVEKITTPEQREAVAKYVEVARNRTERERMSEVKRISGVFTGGYCINPLSNEKVPVWIADYVLAGYGTGAVMAVPSSDTRDYAFAKHFNLPITDILEGPVSDISKDNFNPKSGTMINSGFLNGLPWDEAIEKALQKVEELGIGVRKVNYRMRDAIFGRQRYWGEPFPVYYRDGVPHLVDDNELPVTLPEIDEYRPTESGEPPLARAADWKYRPAGSSESFPFELTTMPGWAGSSWYWYRYMDPKNENAFCSKDVESYWKDVDLYIGGSEHATGHLLYSRFWNKALRDLGYVNAEEPFRKMINQGHIQGVSKLAYRLKLIPPVVQEIFISSDLAKELVYEPDFERVDAILSENRVAHERIEEVSYVPIHVDVDMVNNELLDITRFRKWRPELEHAILITNKDGEFQCHSEIEKMSKSKHNVVNPDDIVEKYGADTLRMYEMFLGPLELSKPWNTNGIDGVYKFLRKFWNLFHNDKGVFNVSEVNATNKELRVLHKTIKKIADDIDRFAFNTSVSEFMICANELQALKCNKRAILEPLTIALSSFAPHIAEEIWELLGHKETVLQATYPEYDEQYLVENSFEYPISINGKVRTKMNFALDMPEADIEKLVLASETIRKWTAGRAPRKVIIVPGKIVNVVI
jgi:leucyl-tRNA synthetase